MSTWPLSTIVVTGQEAEAYLESVKGNLSGLFESGQAHFQAREFVEAARAWLQFWKLLKRHLKPRHKTVDAAQKFAPGQCDMEYWVGNFEQALHNGSLRDRSLIPLGREFLREWLAQFSEDELNRMTTHNALVEFTMRDGDVATARELMDEMLARWPATAKTMTAPDREIGSCGAEWRWLAPCRCRRPGFGRTAIPDWLSGSALARNTDLARSMLA
jgi:hypothetical protein